MVSLLLLVIVASVAFGRLAPESVDTRTYGVPFSVAPPCTVPFEQESFTFEVAGVAVLLSRLSGRRGILETFLSSS